MRLLDRFNPFRKKSAENPASVEDVTPQKRAVQSHTDRVCYLLAGSPYKNTKSHIELFTSVPEVFFPIDFIARRIAGAEFEIRRTRDDSIVWCSGHGKNAKIVTNLLKNPNCLQKFDELVYCHIVYKLCEGNAFMRSAMSSDINPEEKFRWVSNLWTLPGSLITTKLKNTSVPLYGVCDLDDLIGCYVLNVPGSTPIKIPTAQIWHDRDTLPAMDNSSKLAFSGSRLDSVMPAIETVQAVYTARNTIYSKSGAIGIITNKARDEAGHQAYTEEERKELHDHYNQNYGLLNDNQSPVLITDADVNYIRTAMSIKELEPFEETLLDAITIAGAYGIPDVLVPRKDHSTFSNQSTAEKGVYTGIIIPMANQFCKSLTDFLGLEKAGYYISCSFSTVDCLQQGMKEAEEVKKLVNERCEREFHAGLICFNAWRAEIHENALEGDVFNKTKFEMSPEELDFIYSIINYNTRQPQQEKNNGEEEKSTVTDEDAGR